MIWRSALVNFFSFPFLQNQTLTVQTMRFPSLRGSFSLSVTMMLGKRGVISGALGEVFPLSLGMNNFSQIDFSFSFNLTLLDFAKAVNL